MSDLSGISTEDLQREIERRGATPWCRCGKWKTRVSAWDHHGRAVRCSGCLRIVSECHC